MQRKHTYFVWLAKDNVKFSCISEAILQMEFARKNLAVSQILLKFTAFFVWLCFKNGWHLENFENKWWSIIVTMFMPLLLTDKSTCKLNLIFIVMQWSFSLVRCCITNWCQKSNIKLKPFTILLAVPVYQDQHFYSKDLRGNIKSRSVN